MGKRLVLVGRPEIKQFEWTIGEISVAVDLLNEMRNEINKFYRDKENFPNEDRLYAVIGKRVVEWFDE